MKKTSKILALVLALCMVMSLSAFASGEASDESVMAMNASAEASAPAYQLTADGFAENGGAGIELKAGVISAEGADGVEMNVTEFTTALFSVSDGEYTIKNSTITKEVTGPVDANATGGAIAAVSSGTLIIDNCTFINAGKGGRNGNYTVECKNTGVMVVINSDIIQTGLTGDPAGYTMDIADPPSNAALTISGYARSNMSYGKSQTYYYGSYVETEGWAAMSTDSAQTGFAFYSYDSVGMGLKGGYATYADTSCVDWFYATDLIAAEIGAIISNNGEIHMNNGSAATPEALAYLPADYVVTERYGDGRSSLQAGRNAVQIHSPDMGGGGARGDYHGVLDLVDTDIAVTEELAAQATLIDWNEYNVALGEYVDFVSGAAFLVKSTGAYITLDNCTAESYTNTLLLTAPNSDSMSRYAHADDDMTGKGAEMTIKNSDIAGDVKHYDYQRNCVVTLDNATWSGAYNAYDKAQWDALWSEECKADASCYWILDTGKYFDGTGTTASMNVGAGSVWNVTGESRIDALTVEAGGVVNGTVTVGGAAVDVTAGGSWTGDIVIAPAEGASAGGDVFAMYVEYIRAQLQQDEFFEEFTAVLNSVTEETYDESAMPFQMLIEFGAQTYADFAAENAPAVEEPAPAEAPSGEADGFIPPDPPADLAPGEEPPGGFGGID